MPGTTRNVLIVGAGIGGLTLALALIRRGFEVTVLEQATELRELGAGLQLGPNGTRVVTGLGLGPVMRRIVCPAAGKEIRLWSTGQTWPLFDLGESAVERYGAPYWMVHRGDFHTLLLEALRKARPDAVRLGATATAFEQDTAGVTLHLASGERHRGDVLIGAEGVHSCIRQQMFGASRARFTGLMVWRGLVPMERLPPHQRSLVGANWVGAGRHAVTYPLRRGEILNFVAAVARDDWRVESWTERGTTEECLTDFAGWHEDVQRIIRNIDVPYKMGPAGSRAAGTPERRPRGAAGRCGASDAAVPRAGRQHGDRGRDGAGALSGELCRSGRGTASVRHRAARPHHPCGARFARQCDAVS